MYSEIYKVNFVRKDKSKWMSLIGKADPSFMTTVWTTIGNTIYYPTTIGNPEWPGFHPIVEHELVHVEQFKKWTVPFFLFLYIWMPMPFFFAYFRWRFEREAYLVDLKMNDDEDVYLKTRVEWIVNSLWSNYFFTWPKSWMRKWFYKELGLKE